ncbi:peptidylprolyl isomerase [Phenylobacterium montanum]|uniref:peptidylprolyl isomerase n=1 Tax=Phenylobacterium montanum TaxID=2823693 RepID=A0A975IWR8_9CAUL|nr:peptidylprolyl isomerase [Caulobacter sp. S6]QUD89879.1 peptidylprolyl isomerase [Caulobacter sp. S6]
MGALRVGRRGLLAGAGAWIAAPALADTAKPQVTLKTSHGTIVVELESEKAPLTSANFLRYAAAGNHDGANFFRASRTEGAPDTGLIEGRLSTNTAKLFPPIKHESTTLTGLKHVDGTLSMARGALNTARVDFFICIGPSSFLDADPSAPGDNQGYAAFGQVTQGMDVVKAILALPTPGKAKNPAMAGQILDPPIPISIKKG